eukprot:290957_1
MFSLGIVVIFSLSSSLINGQCIYTNSDGKYCRCDGENKNCEVGMVDYAECGDTWSAQLILLNECITKEVDPKRVSYIQSCQHGEITRTWYSDKFCNGVTTVITSMAQNYKPCATILCDYVDVDASSSTAHHAITSVILLFISLFYTIFG